MTLTDAVRAGARPGRRVAASVFGREAAVEDRVRDSAVNLNQGQLDVDVTATWDQGADVTVRHRPLWHRRFWASSSPRETSTSTATERVE